MIVFDKPIALNRKALHKKGFFIRNVSGAEHPRSLMDEILHGRHMTSGRPHVLAYGGLVFASISGTECAGESEEDCLRAINQVRTRRGLDTMKTYVH